MSGPAVQLVEVGPRDGLQNEAAPLSVGLRAGLVEALIAAGCRRIEAGAFVNPRAVPRMAGSDEVFDRIRRRPGVRLSALVPNLKGFEAALAAGADEVAVFTAASEGFARANTNATIAQTLERFAPVLERAQQAGIATRGYVSCAIACPYDGFIDPAKVAEVAAALVNLGCDEVSLGDTIGVGTPKATAVMIDRVALDVPLHKLALHPHDTYGQALVNALTALERGVGVFDSAVAGLGGCPFAPGASGNLASEDLVYMLEGQGVGTGVDLDALARAAEPVLEALGRTSASKAGAALAAKRRRTA